MIFFLLSVLSVSQFAPETHVFDGNASKERIAADIAAIAEAGLDWRAPAVGGVQTGVLVTVSLPEKGSSMFHADVDLSPWKGKILKATIRSKGTDVCAAKEDWLGYKFMFSFRDAKTGCMDWLGAPKEVGSWDWKETCARVDLRHVLAQMGRCPQAA